MSQKMGSCVGPRYSLKLFEAFKSDQYANLDEGTNRERIVVIALSSSAFQAFIPQDLILFASLGTQD